MVHVHSGGTLVAYCGIALSDATTFVAWEDAAKVTCPGCAIHFGRLVPQFGPEWVQHVLAGGTVVAGNILVTV